MRVNFYEDEISFRSDSKDDTMKMKEFYNQLGRQLHGNKFFAKAIGFKANVTLVKKEGAGFELSLQLDKIRLE